MNLAKTILGGAIGVLLLSISSCHTGSSSPDVSSQTNWLKACEKPADCEEFDCICGICTTSCKGSSDCKDLTGASCIAKGEPGTIAACDGKPAETGMCLPSCDDQACSDGTTCIAGTCVGARESTSTVTIDPSTKYQSLIGFGASVTGNEDTIVDHPEKDAIFDAMFSESGFEMIRFGNQFDGDTELDLTATSEIISEAESRLGFDPLLFMTSNGPPAALKANGDRLCANADVDCTLVRDAEGEFDYAGFAEHWRASLEAYEAAGIHPDYVSIQNNADYVPGNDEPQEACRLLGSESTISVLTPDGLVDAEFAGYSEAMAAVSAAVGTLPESYSFSGPEVGSVVMVDQYTDSLEFADSVSFHLYLANPDEQLITQLESLRNAAEAAGKPVLQSGMSAEGLDTAVLTQMSLTHANASAYLQQTFVGDESAEDANHLIGVNDKTFVKLPAYYALSHFARSTERGWNRVHATLNSSGVLSSAWMPPEEDAITIILVNPTTEPQNIELGLLGSYASLLDSATVVRTVFDGVERAVDLGELSNARVVRVPGNSIVTVASISE